MRIIFSLFRIDILQIIRWFSQEKLSKLLVLLGFLVIFILLSSSLYFFSRIFFQVLVTNEIYGLTIAHYILNASIILVFWFAIGSTFVSIITLLSTINPSVDYLFTQPIRPIYILTWFFFKSTFINYLLQIIIFVPIVMSYELIFYQQVNIFFLSKLLFVIFIIVIISGSLGNLLAYLLFPYVRRINNLGKILYISVFFILSYLLIQFIFPKSLNSLYDASIENYWVIYQQLPLLQIYSPTNWLIATLKSKFNLYDLYSSLGITFFSYSVLYFQGIRVIEILKQQKDQIPIDLNFKKNNSRLLTNKISNLQYNLILKDWYSIIRVPSEVSYGIFLLMVISFFYFFLWKATTTHPINIIYQKNILLFSFGWLMFFAVAYFLRLVFPLMSREGNSIWYIFTIPINRNKLLNSKIILGLTLSLPLFLLSFVLWLLIPNADKYLSILIGLSCIGVINICIVQIFSGSSRPIFYLHYDPEKVSTSASGLGTLFISIMIIMGMLWILNLFLSVKINIFMTFGITLLFSSVLIAILYLWTRYSIERYDFSKVNYS